MSSYCTQLKKTSLSLITAEVTPIKNNWKRVTPLAVHMQVTNARNHSYVKNWVIEIAGVGCENSLNKYDCNLTGVTASLQRV